jgi:NADPH:quinone reductase-like Zn-dependent oxidoreductase
MTRMANAKSLWLTDRRQAELRTVALGSLAQDEVLIESRYGAISRGTEALVANGAVPESEYGRMKAPLQEGEFPFPIKYGYAVVGKVASGPREKLGETVFCLHPHQDVFHAPAEMAIPVPAVIPPGRAILAANMETALNAIWDAGIMAGDRVAVVGAGLVGLLAAFLAAKVPGTMVTVVDLNVGRRSLAEIFGCSFATPEDVEALTGSADVVIHASASSEGLATAISLAAFEARIVEMSWFGDRGIEVALGGAFHSQRLSIVASQVGHVPAARRARWPLARRLETALALLDDDRLDGLISGETAFEDLAGPYCDILSDPDTLCHRIRYC